MPSVPPDLRGRPGRLRGPLLLAALVAALAACSSGGGPTEPGDDLLSRLAGTWDGTEMVITSQDSDLEATVDILGGGFGVDASFVLEIGADGRYTATLTALQISDEETGTIEVTESSITLDPDGADPPVSGTWSLEGDTLVIDGDTEFDFDGDGTDDPARLHLELVRR